MTVFRGRRESGGFTLVELIVVMVILAVLVAVALPSYTSYVARARRAEARTQLLQVAQFMQRFYSSNDSYAMDRAGNSVTSQMPANLKQSPADSAALYALEIPAESLTAAGFALRMVPVAGTSMAGDKCGAFTLDSTGVRGVLIGSNAGSAELRDSCWK